LSIERAGYFRREGGQVSGLIGRLHASGFHARKIQEGIDELEQSEPVAPHRNQLFVMFGTQPLACCRQHFLKGAEHQRQRRSELVTDVAEKRGLGAIDLGERLCPLAFLLVGAGAGQPDRDLFCNPKDELAVLIVKGPAGMDSRDKEPNASPYSPSRIGTTHASLGGDGQLGTGTPEARLPSSTRTPSFASAGSNRQRFSPRQSMTGGRKASPVSTQSIFEHPLRRLQRYVQHAAHMALVIRDRIRRKR
jgi:hypothetical protein